MYQIGIDVGSTYTKYCITDADKGMIHIWAEETPVRQREYFEKKVYSLRQKYGDAKIVSCGYGKKNVGAVQSISELTALACGCAYVGYNSGTIIDIGGQDTKLVVQKDGRIQEFFVNEKCAAGCGMFLTSTLHLLKMDFQDIDLKKALRPPVLLSSVCAVFAQSEIVELLAQDYAPQIILQAVVWQILNQAKAMLTKVRCQKIVFSGGLSNIPGISRYAEMAWGIPVDLPDKAAYLSAVGCAAQHGKMQA